MAAEVIESMSGFRKEVERLIGEEYEKRMLEHEERVRGLMSAEFYTPEYGKIDITDELYITVNIKTKRPSGYDTQYERVKLLDNNIHPNNRWIIKIIRYGETATFIDNFGEMYNMINIPCGSVDYEVPRSQHKTTYMDHIYSNIRARFMRELVVSYESSSKSNRYPLPDIIINIIKEISGQGKVLSYLTEDLSKHYYECIAAFSPLFKSASLTDYTALLKEREAHLAEIAEEKQKIATHEQTIASLKEQLAASNAENLSQRQIISSIEIAAVKANKQRDTQTARIAELEVILKEKDTQISTLTVQADGWRAETVKAEKKAEELSKCVSNLEDTDTTSDLEERLAAANREIAKLRSDCNTLTTKNERLKQKLEDWICADPA